VNFGSKKRPLVDSDCSFSISQHCAILVNVPMDKLLLLHSENVLLIAQLAISGRVLTLLSQVISFFKRNLTIFFLCNSTEDKLNSKFILSVQIELIKEAYCYNLHNGRLRTIRNSTNEKETKRGAGYLQFDNTPTWAFFSVSLTSSETLNQDRSSHASAAAVRLAEERVDTRLSVGV
jgi:hypothetical protein